MQVARNDGGKRVSQATRLLKILETQHVLASAGFKESQVRDKDGKWSKQGGSTATKLTKLKAQLEKDKATWQDLIVFGQLEEKRNSSQVRADIAKLKKEIKALEADDDGITVAELERNVAKAKELSVHKDALTKTLNERSMYLAGKSEEAFNGLHNTVGSFHGNDGNVLNNMFPIQIFEGDPSVVDVLTDTYHIAVESWPKYREALEYVRNEGGMKDALEAEDDIFNFYHDQFQEHKTLFRGTSLDEFDNFMQTGTVGEGRESNKYGKSHDFVSSSLSFYQASDFSSSGNQTSSLDVVLEFDMSDIPEDDYKQVEYVARQDTHVRDGNRLYRMKEGWEHPTHSIRYYAEAEFHLKKGSKQKIRAVHVDEELSTNDERTIKRIMDKYPNVQFMRGGEVYTTRSIAGAGYKSSQPRDKDGKWGDNESEGGEFTNKPSGTYGGQTPTERGAEIRDMITNWRADGKIPKDQDPLIDQFKALTDPTFWEDGKRIWISDRLSIKGKGVNNLFRLQNLMSINEIWNKSDKTLRKAIQRLTIKSMPFPTAANCSHKNNVEINMDIGITSLLGKEKRKDQLESTLHHEGGHAVFNMLGFDTEQEFIKLSEKLGSITQYHNKFAQHTKELKDSMTLLEKVNNKRNELEFLESHRDQAKSEAVIVSEIDRVSKEYFTLNDLLDEAREYERTGKKSNAIIMAERTGASEFMAAFYRYHHLKKGNWIVNDEAYQSMLPFYNKHIKGKFVGAAGFDKNQVRDARR